MTQAMLLWYFAIIGSSVLMLGIGLYIFAIAISKTIKGCLFTIKRNTGTKIDENNFSEQFTEFIEFIEFHSYTKQLS